jgi:hypothetical protein
MKSKQIWISPHDAINAVLHSIRAHNLDENIDIANAIRFGHPETPLLVMRQDIPGQAYYLIQWVIEGGTVLIAQVDALTGLMESVTPIPKAVSHPFISPDEAINIAYKNFKKCICSKAHLIWRPCRESTSPLYPFYELTCDDTTIYIDMNGYIFTKLTPLELGGR